MSIAGPEDVSEWPEVWRRVKVEPDRAAALRAAARPRTTGEIFFVATGEPDGSHRFSRTYREHQQAVVAMQTRQRARRAAASAEGSR